MATLRLAFDESSVRTIDANGWLHVSSSNISKATVNPYYGSEIPGYEALGLDPSKVYRMLRDPVELERGAPSFERLPIISTHVPLSVDSLDKELIVGNIGSNVVFDSPYLKADLCFIDATAIAGIDTKQVCELSCCYQYTPVMEAGLFDGQPYDGRMTEIRGNHLALVEKGRAGPDVLVADKEIEMKYTKFGKLLFATLGGMSAALAADAALPALVHNVTLKTFDPKALAPKVLAMDATLDAAKLTLVFDAMADGEDDPKAKEPDEPPAKDSTASQLRAMLKAAGVDDEVITKAVALLGDAPAADENPDDDKEPKMDKKAMDAAIAANTVQLRAETRDANQAREDVREVVGNVLAMDTAPEIYGFALDHLKVDREGVEGTKALRALFNASKPKAQIDTGALHVAMDASGLEALVGKAAMSRVKRG